MTERRRLLGAAAMTWLSVPGCVLAQTTGRVYRLGILRPTGPGPEVSPALLDTLRDMGYVEGRNLVVERRFAGGQFDRLDALARDLVAAPVDVILAVGSAAVRAAREASSAIPVVMFGNFDPIALGHVSNLARPEANVTGVMISAEGTLAAKRLELLREVVPRAARLAMLVPVDANFRLQLEETRKAAMALKLGLEAVEVREGDYATAFARIAALRADGLVVGAHTFFMLDRKPIIALAARHRLSAVYEWPEQVRDGGLLAYGTSLDVLYARLAAYVGQLFRGRKPSELPVEQPATFNVALNLRTARALDLAIPQSLLLRAAEVVQ